LKQTKHHERKMCAMKTTFLPLSLLAILGMLLGPGCGSSPPSKKETIDKNIQAILAASETKMTAGDSAASNYFGVSVAIWNNTAVVGADYRTNGSIIGAGAVYIYVKSGSTWTQQAILTADDGEMGDRFGTLVAIYRDTVVVGAPWAGTTERGAAYVFVRSGTTWTQQAKLTPDVPADNDYFGYAVAISGETIVVGCPEGTNPVSKNGAAYVFTRSGTTWTQQAKLTASDGAVGDQFGQKVALYGTNLLIGAQTLPTTTGKVYAFSFNGSTWTQNQIITGSDSAVGDYFGMGVAIWGTTAVLGASNNATGGVAAGAAYVFSLSAGTWTQQAKLTAHDGAASDAFGYQVGIYQDVIIVGAPNDDDRGLESGSAYLFTRQGTRWSQEAKLVSSTGAAIDLGGAAVTVFERHAIVGAQYADLPGQANAGAASFYEVRAPGCSSATLTSSVSNAVTGSLVNLQAGATCDDGANPSYRFFMMAPGSSTYTELRSWGESALVFDTTGRASGTYTFLVYVRSAFNTLVSVQVYTTKTVNVAPTFCNSTSLLINGAPATIIPAITPGTSVTLSGTCTGAAAGLFRFFARQSQNSTNIEIGGSNWASSKTFDFAGWENGNYYITISARASSNPSTVSESSSAAYKHIANPGTLCGQTTIGISPSSPRPAGTLIDLTGTCDGAEGDEQHRFYYRPAAASAYIEILPNLSWRTSTTWDTTGLTPGNYVLFIYTRKAGSLQAWEANRTAAFVIQ
jgi:hypothetical protein